MVLPSQEGVVLLGAGREPGSDPAPVLPTGDGVGMSGWERSNDLPLGGLTTARRRDAYLANGVEMAGATWCGKGRRINPGSVELMGLSRGSGWRVSMFTCKVICVLRSGNVRSAQ